MQGDQYLRWSPFNSSTSTKADCNNPNEILSMLPAGKHPYFSVDFGPGNLDLLTWSEADQGDSVFVWERK